MGEGIDLDSWMDPFICETVAALATERVGIGSICDALRRTPVNLAQQILSLDHVSKGRVFHFLGAGEAKQFTAYGLKREKPFTHLQEAVRLVKLFRDNSEPFSYEGPIWTCKDAMLSLPPYDAGDPPPIYVAGGPGRSVEIAGRYADGWCTFPPPTGEPEWVAESITRMKQLAEEAGRDPEKMRFFGMFSALIAGTEAELDPVIDHPLVRWDSAMILSTSERWRDWGAENPMGDDYHYARDYNPFDWSREDAYKVIDQVTPDIVRRSKLTGTPAQAADRVQPYIDAGMTDILLANYATLVTAGDFADAVTGQMVVLETINLIRERNGIPIPTGAQL